MASRKIILLLSGEISSGKSSLSSGLMENYGFIIFKTRDFLVQRLTREGKPVDRVSLQRQGQLLDRRTNQQWVLEEFQALFNESGGNLFVIDSVRTKKQVEAFRRAYSFSVIHVHLVASAETLAKRFFGRGELAAVDQSSHELKYKAMKADKVESKVHLLKKDADLIVDTENSTDIDVLIRVAGFLKLLTPTSTPLVDVIIGGQFGSEGKGQIAAHIAPEYDCLVRVGGPNAGHTVYNEPSKDVFHHLPSGTYRNKNAKIVLGPGAVLLLDKLLEEISKYLADENDVGRLIIDENAIVISKEDREYEQALKDHIGSTGQGVGAATANNLLKRLKGESDHKAKNYPQLRPYIGNALAIYDQMYRDGKKILLEGTQGSGLSLFHGPYPHVTSRDTSVSGCLSESGISPARVNRVMLVVRSYPIRVGGNSGPFGSKELSVEEVALRSGKPKEEIEKTEITTTTKKKRRIAEFSWEWYRKACELNSPTDIVLTFADYISVKNVGVHSYERLTPETRQMIEELERCSGVKVSMISTTFDYRAIIDRRNW